jgi:hypothetical protein
MLLAEDKLDAMVLFGNLGLSGWLRLKGLPSSFEESGLSGWLRLKGLPSSVAMSHLARASCSEFERK